MDEIDPKVDPGKAIFNWLNLGLTMPSDHASFQCYNDLQKKLGGDGEDISVWRFASISREKGVGISDPDNIFHIVIITGDEAKMHRAQKIAADYGAEPWDVPDDVIQGLTMRRLRLIIAASEQGVRHVHQEASYQDEGGVRISDEGEVTPYQPKEKDE